MIRGRKVLGIIPARGGSKRLPGKNIMPFAGKPMMAWTIEAALASGVIDRLILSSDDPGIIEVARTHGCEVPFVRPADLAGDQASSSSVVCHAIDSVGDGFEMIVLLQPTSPLRTAEDIAGTVELAASGPAESAVSVAPLYKPADYFGDMSTGRFVAHDFFAGTTPCTINGAVYAIGIERFRRINAFMDNETLAYRMPVSRSIDVDDLEEFRMAEALMNVRLTAG